VAWPVLNMEGAMKEEKKDLELTEEQLKKVAGGVTVIGPDGEITRANVKTDKVADKDQLGHRDKKRTRP